MVVIFGIQGTNLALAVPWHEDLNQLGFRIYILNAIFIPSIVIPVPIIARINPINFPTTVIK
ncbi:MAG: hypothetical protein K8R74_15195, partial [Bacteroidales bacterium]|nr:hypothetical protein [Bacteroidales bacterium]